jgi:hypothetical protein
MASNLLGFSSLGNRACCCRSTPYWPGGEVPENWGQKQTGLEVSTYYLITGSYWLMFCNAQGLRLYNQVDKVMILFLFLKLIIFNNFTSPRITITNGTCGLTAFKHLQGFRFCFCFLFSFFSKCSQIRLCNNWARMEWHKGRCK